MNFLIFAILCLFFPIRPMKQDIPLRGQRRAATPGSSAYDYSTAGVPYRPLRLTRHQVTLPGEVSPVIKSVWKRLLLLAVMLGFGVVCVHGGAARWVLSKARFTSGEDETPRVAFESGR